jgi:hypothetical protein
MLDLTEGNSAYVSNVCFEEGVFICITFAKYIIHNVSLKKSDHKYCETYLIKFYLTSTVPAKMKMHRIAEIYKVAGSVLDKSAVLKHAFFWVMHGLDLTGA